MLRKSAISLAVIGVLNATHANALGLGDVQISSALNQPLNAEIDLLQLRGLDASQIITSLADTNDFYLAGVKPSAILSDIRFKLDISGGNGKIILTTTDPIKEPFLNFLIEVNWPSGRLVREYTVLLDPPVFTADDLAPQAQPVAPVAQSAGSSTGSSNRSTTTATGTMTAGAGQYHVNNDDTLWQIALKTRPDASISPQQMMMAIQNANPNAFFDNNINRLKSGVVLAIPSKNQILGMSPQASLQEVKRQNKSWKGAPATAAAKPGAAKLDATKADMNSSAAPASEDAQLRIVSKTADESPAETQPAATVASETSEEASNADQGMTAELASKNEQLEEQLVVTLEGLDKVERDNAEMFERLDRLTEQMESMARLVELKDQQLAQLQTQLSQKQLAPVEQESTPASMTDSLPMEMIGGAVAAVLALLAGLFAFMRKRRQDQDVEEALVVLNQQDGYEGDDTDVDAQTDDALAAAPVESDDLAGLDDSDIAAFDLPEENMVEASELDEIAVEDDSDDPFNMATDSAEPSDEFDTISDTELDDALGSDLDMDLKLDEPIAEDSEMEAFSNSLLDDDEYDLSTGLDEDEEAVDDAGLDSGLDALLAEDDSFDGADADIQTQQESVETAPVVEGVDELDDGFGSDLDDLLAEDSADLGESFDEGAEDGQSLDALLAGSDEEMVDDLLIEPAASESELDEDSIPDDDALDALLSEAEGESADDLSVDLEGFDEFEGETVAVQSDEIEVNHLEVDEMPEQMLDIGDIEDEGEKEFELPSEEIVDLDSKLESAVDSDQSEVAPEAVIGAEDGLDLDLSSEIDAEAEQFEPVAEADAEAEPQIDDIALDLDLDDAADDALDFSVDDTDSVLDAEPAVAESDLDALLQQTDSQATAETPTKSALSLEEDLDEAGDAELEAELEQMLGAEDNALALQETDLDGDEINYLDSADEVGTKIDLARAYIDMDDQDGARDILQEVLGEGSAEQIAEANQLLESMKS